jgi:two-component system nitrate/nitrite response regulator NarL
MQYSWAARELDLSAARTPVRAVSTVLLSRNNLLRSGSGNFLSGTCFVLSECMQDNLSRLSKYADEEAILFLIDESRSTDENVAIIARLKREIQSARVVLLGDQLEPAAGIQLYESGLDGFCSTAMGQLSVVKALEIVMLGEVFLPGPVVLAMLNRMQSATMASVAAPRMHQFANDASQCGHMFSSREAGILQCLTEGASNKGIAQSLKLSEETVKVYLRAIMKKLNASNRTQVALWALQHLSTADCDARMYAAE